MAAWPTAAVHHPTTGGVLSQPCGLRGFCGLFQRTRGSYRLGSGRKPGIPNSKTLEIRDRAAREGNTPLEVILSIMNERLATGDQDGALVAVNVAPPTCTPDLRLLRSKWRPKFDPV